MPMVRVEGYRFLAKFRKEKFQVCPSCFLCKIWILVALTFFCFVLFWAYAILAVSVHTSAFGEAVADHCRWELRHGCTTGCQHPFQELHSQKLVTS